MKEYTAVVEQDRETGLYVGYFPGFPGAHSQADTLDELNTNLREVVEMLLEVGEPMLEGEFVGTLMSLAPLTMAKQLQGPEHPTLLRGPSHHGVRGVRRSSLTLSHLSGQCGVPQ